MKKILITLVSSLLVLASCTEKPEITLEPATLPRTITLTASLPQTKVAVNTDEGADKGKVTWSAGDAIAVYNTEGAKYPLTIVSGVGEDNATFSGDFTGTLSGFAIYPADYAASATSIQILDKQEWASGKVPAIMAAKIEGENIGVSTGTATSTATLYFKALMPVFEFTLENVPAYARAIKLSSASGAALQGTHSIQENCTLAAISSGSSTSLTIGFPYKQACGLSGHDSSITFYVPMPSYAYTDLTLDVLDGDEDSILASPQTIPSATGAYFANGANAYVRIPTPLSISTKVDSERDNYIKVAGIKWAKGNLSFNETTGTTGAGFQMYWSLYDEQWKYYNYDAPIYNGGTAYNGTAKDTRYDNTANIFEHFNWGGLGKNSRLKDSGNYLTATTANFSIVKKIFSDATMSSEAGEEERFSNPGWTEDITLMGDLAYWASKGKYRLPSSSEITELYVNDGNKNGKKVKVQFGHIIKNGYNIWGVLYTTIPTWDSTADKISTDDIELTDADLASGVFLPKCGRRANTSQTVIQQRVQGTYWTGNYGALTNNGTDYSNCPRILHINGTVIAYGFTLGATAYTNNAGYAIRPVYIPEAER
ncbi:MAG: hypothetical protein IJU68_08230 [Bacteroidales bacterium]|nr:hypothetical protein [Bacteroidales bacterium]